MRKINKIIIHCADTPEGRDDSIKDVRRWHKARGFNDVGYHFVIRLDGEIEKGRDEAVIGAHAKGHNKDSLGVCYIGGKDGDTRTPEQKTSLVYLIGYLKNKYKGAIVYGHMDFSTKKCPQFDAKTEYCNV